MIFSQDGTDRKVRPQQGSSRDPVPYEVPGEERIKRLEGYLKVERIKSQRSNIQFVINMYQTGKLKSLLGPPNGISIYVCDGQVYHFLPNLEEIWMI